MVDKIFVNLPVKNLKKTTRFFKKVGFTFNKQFTDEKAACLVIGKNIFAMLIVEKYFKTFTKKKISNARKQTEVLLALHVWSRKAVDAIVKKAIAAGGSLYMDPFDHGWMYGHSFADLDGHQWEVFFMDEKKIPKHP